MLSEQTNESETSEAMRAMRESGAVVRIDVDTGHRIFIEAVIEDDGYGLVDHYEVRTRGSHVKSDEVKREGLWVLRALARNEFVLVR